MFVHHGIQDWGLGAWIYSRSLKWGFFSIWSYSIQSPCYWLNPPLHPWHLSIRSLAVGFALRVNKGGNLINMEAHLKMGLFCFFTYICIQWILFIYEYVHSCICISTGMRFVVQLGKLYLCMPKKIWQQHEQSFFWLIGKQYFSVRGVIWIMYCKAFSSCVGYNTFCSIGSCIKKLT